MPVDDFVVARTGVTDVGTLAAVDGPSLVIVTGGKGQTSGGHHLALAPGCVFFLAANTCAGRGWFDDSTFPLIFGHYFLIALTVHAEDSELVLFRAYCVQ